MDAHRKAIIHGSGQAALALLLVRRLVYGEDGCWYISGTRGDYYPYITTPDGRLRAHQLAFKLVHGYLPPMVCHTCDHPGCWKPAHLFGGDRSANMKDCFAKGRHPGVRNPNSTANLPPPQRGETNPSNKLTRVQVLTIRARGTEGHTKLGREFGVCRETIRDILRRKVWRHV